ncbi:hypothetical protein [Yoonia maritima]|uniref:capsular polysaccharide export protein, LipB/KpsS family n=1 Tax=Yoonia maritima TaxID=1435347 RepID=UPI000D1136DD|nr:hypothetical protein [Yoonia maritima]
MFHYVDQPNMMATPKVLILQGPVGPFFKELQRGLSAAGFATKRVVFNAADQLFAGAGESFRFTGSPDDWTAWLETEMRDNRPDYIVVFGARRPVHATARKVAALFGVRVICLEEGYLRSGFITCELGGNNDSSPLCDWKWQQDAPQNTPKPVDMPRKYGALGIWSTIYYLVRDFRSSPDEVALFHRKHEGIGTLAVSWAAHMGSRALARLETFTKLKRLKNELNGQYIVVTLQTPQDSQLQFAARGWSNEKLISDTLGALKDSAAKDTIVFKLHPMDRRVGKTRRFIEETARQLNLADRIMVLNFGAIGDVVNHASGMIVINSTSAFSALHHHIPLLVLGDAIYRHENLVTVGTETTTIQTFLASRKVKSVECADAFIEAVKARALLPGDFYYVKGRKVAVDAITKKLEQDLVLSREQEEVV